MKVVKSFDPLKIINTLPDIFMNLSELDQHISLSIYQIIGKGLPASIEQLAESVHISTNDLKSKLLLWPGVSINRDEEVVRFWGISLENMYHTLEFEDAKVYAWCAWDALFIPELVQKKAIIKSKCPITKEEIVLTIDSNGNITSKNEDVVVSFLLPEETAMLSDVITNLSHFVYFFSSLKAGEEWTKDHKGTYLISLEEATTLSQLKNSLQFKDTL